MYVFLHSPPGFLHFELTTSTGFQQQPLTLRAHIYFSSRNQPYTFLFGRLHCGIPSDRLLAVRERLFSYGQPRPFCSDIRVQDSCSGRNEYPVFALSRRRPVWVQRRRYASLPPSPTDVHTHINRWWATAAYYAYRAYGVRTERFYATSVATPNDSLLCLTGRRHAQPRNHHVELCLPIVRTYNARPVRTYDICIPCSQLTAAQAAAGSTPVKDYTVAGTCNGGENRSDPPRPSTC